MKSRKLKPAPSFHCLDMQKSIDNICEYTFESETARTAARIYLYRRCLGMSQYQAAKIFKMDVPTINGIVYYIGANKNREIKTLEATIQKQFKYFHVGRYYNHLKKITNRINNRTLALQ